MRRSRSKSWWFFRSWFFFIQRYIIHQLLGNTSSVFLCYGASQYYPTGNRREILINKAIFSLDIWLLDSFLPCVFLGKLWVFRERAPSAPHFFNSAVGGCAKSIFLNNIAIYCVFAFFNNLTFIITGFHYLWRKKYYEVVYS